MTAWCQEGAARYAGAVHGARPTERAGGEHVTGRGWHGADARERAVTMNRASAQEDPAPDMITSARGAAKTTELREEPAQRASDARPAMLRRIPAVAVLPVPRLHLEEFFGWQSTKPHQTEASPRTCCLGHSLFEAELPYDTLSDAKLEEVLDMLTSCKEDATNTSHARRWSTGSLPAHVVLRHT